MSNIRTALSTTRCELRKFYAEESGATAVEYAMIASGIAVAISAMVYSLGSSVKGLFTTVSSAY